MLTQPLAQLIQSRTGLRIQAQQKVALEQIIQARMKVLKLATLDHYYQYLTNSISSENIHSTQLHQEWQYLIQPLIIGESYFLRDQGQFQVLQRHLLPELIEQRRQQAITCHTKPTLRLWSAGCSTGEEPYSLAILVRQLIPDWRNWDLFIVGTDINADAIAHAQRGLYDSWSFRCMDTTVQSQYFQAYRGKWELNSEVRNMVTFCSGNLVQDPFPSLQSGLCRMDLIVCRNVFIYFDPQSIATVLAKFAKTLNPGGYLITGHTELYNQNLATLHTKVYAESIVYQRDEIKELKERSVASRQVPDRPSAVTIPMLAPKKETPVQPGRSSLSDQDRLSQNSNLLEKAEQCFQRGDYAGAISISETLITQNPQCLESHHLMAQSYLGLGAYEQAKHYAQKTAEMHTLSTAPYYLLAHIAREQKQSDQAKDLLKRIIYLEPTAITAYLELSSIYIQEGNLEKAKKMKSTALELMQKTKK